MSEAINSAIQGTGEPVAEQDERNKVSPPSDTSLVPNDEGGAAAVPSTVTKPLTEEHPASETAPPLPPPYEGPASSNDADRRGPISSGSLFESSQNPKVSTLPKAPDLPEQHDRTEQEPVQHSRTRDTAGVERGDLPRFKNLRVVGQIGSGYILVDELMAAWIVDQHVAHERALLDRLTDPKDGRMPTVQSLLVPEVVQLPPQDAAAAADSLEELSVYGFEVEPFGKDSFRINGVIFTLAERGNVAGGFKEAVSAVRGTAPGMSREERILATIACHSAVKLGDKLSSEEMEALIKDWLTSRYPATCPHGRSICYRIEHRDIARKLDRH